MARISVPAYWRVRRALYTLEGRECLNCGKAHFPPRSRCPYCGSERLSVYVPPRVGKLITWTKLYEVGDDKVHHRPLYIGLVELGNLRVTLPLADVDSDDDLKPGTEVRLVLRRLAEDGEAGIICYGLKAKPMK